MLDPDPPADQLVVPGHHVAAGVDVGIRGPQRRVRHDAVVHGEAGRLGQPGRGQHADTDHDHVGRHLGAVGEDHRADPVAVDRELADAHAEAEVDAVRDVQIPEQGGHFVAEHPSQGQPVDLDHGHRAAVLAGGGRHLQADPARADDHHTCGVLEGVEQCLGVLGATQVVHALGVDAGHVERAHPGTGGQQQLVVAQRLATVEGHGVGRRVDRGDAAAEDQVDVLLRVPARVVHVRLVQGLAAQEEVFGERRPFVRPVLLLTDEHDPAGETLGAQRFSRLRPRQRRSDDHERTPVGFHARCLSIFTATSQ